MSKRNVTSLDVFPLCVIGKKLTDSKWTIINRIRFAVFPFVIWLTYEDDFDRSVTLNPRNCLNIHYHHQENTMHSEKNPPDG